MSDNNHDENLLAELLREVRALATCQHSIREELKDHIARKEEKLDKLVKAFPADDPRGHREYHDALIASAQQRVKIRQAIIEKSLAGIIWVGLVWIAIAIW